MSKLKACPFCGDVEDLQINDDSDKEGTMYVWCYACNVSGPSAVMPEDVWNNRPLEDQLKAHAVEVLAKNIGFLRYCKGNLWIYGDKVTLEEFLSDWVNYDEDDWGEFKNDMRSEARALLGWDNDNNDKEK